MIYTITANLLAETTALYKDDKRGQTHRAVSESFQVGGKGINVAIMVQKLGVPAEAICFPAGHAGQRCLDWLRQQSFSTQSFQQEGETRQGWVVRTNDQLKPETTFLGPDRPMQPAVWDAAFNYLEKVIKPGDWLAISGSIPGWSEVLASRVEAFIRARGNTVSIAVDSYGPPLQWWANQPVQLIKINRKELRSLIGDFSARQLPRILREFKQSKPASAWIITDGPRTLYAIDQNNTVLRADPPRVQEISPVGSGDIILASIITSLSAGESLRQAVARAIPLGAANASRPDVAGFDPATVPPLPLEAIQEIVAPSTRKR